MKSLVRTSRFISFKGDLEFPLFGEVNFALLKNSRQRSTTGPAKTLYLHIMSYLGYEMAVKKQVNLSNVVLGCQASMERVAVWHLLLRMKTEVF